MLLGVLGIFVPCLALGYTTAHSLFALRIAKSLLSCWRCLAAAWFSWRCQSEHAAGGYVLVHEFQEHGRLTCARRDSPNVPRTFPSSFFRIEEHTENNARRLVSKDSILVLNNFSFIEFTSCNEVMLAGDVSLEGKLIDNLNPFFGFELIGGQDPHAVMTKHFGMPAVARST